MSPPLSGAMEDCSIVLGLAAANADMM